MVKVAPLSLDRYQYRLPPTFDDSIKYSTFFTTNLFFFVLPHCHPIESPFSFVPVVSGSDVRYWRDNCYDPLVLHIHLAYSDALAHITVYVYDKDMENGYGMVARAT